MFKNISLFYHVWSYAEEDILRLKKKKSTSIFYRTTVSPGSRQESHRGLALSACRVEACGERATGEPVEPENARARDLIVCLFMKLGTRLALSSLTSPFLPPQPPSLPPFWHFLFLFPYSWCSLPLPSPPRLLFFSSYITFPLIAWVAFHSPLLSRLTHQLFWFPLTTELSAAT